MKTYKQYVEAFGIQRFPQKRRKYIPYEFMINGRPLVKELENRKDALEWGRHNKATTFRKMKNGKPADDKIWDVKTGKVQGK